MDTSSETRFSRQPSETVLLPDDVDPLLIGAADAARLLGVSARTVWTLTKVDGLPHFRIGRRMLYPVDALRRWTAERTRGGVQNP